MMNELQKKEHEQALKVACPNLTCRAEVGKKCFSNKPSAFRQERLVRRTYPYVHPSRRKLGAKNV